MANLKPFSIVSLILAIVAFFTGWVGIGAIILGAIGIAKEGRNWMAILGIILGVLATVGWILCTIY